MELQRASGILLHPTSLPGRFGIGTLGAGARQFVDFLVETGQRVWQVLPLCPTGYGDSPYQCLSAFAGNPLLISLRALVEEGLLSPGDLDGAPPFPDTAVDYGWVIEFKLPMLKRAFDSFNSRASCSSRDAFDEFCLNNAHWLDDYALFMAVKDAHDQIAWVDWEPAIARRRPDAIEAWSRKLAYEIASFKFKQYQFFRQWTTLRHYCRVRGIKIIGDIPLFVAHDSADVWANQHVFRLGTDGYPTVVAGAPPDYFSADGQLWGNPIYRWDVMRADGYRWWIDRFRSAFTLLDMARLDHFRGFESYWEIPATAASAASGRWVKGPGADLLESALKALGDFPAIAENLGFITPEAEELRNRFALPGMAILQFAFGRDPQAPEFKPYKYARNLAAYAGTHDNDTVSGWWTHEGTGFSTRTLADIAEERDLARKYLHTNGTEIHWVFIRALLASVASLAMIPLQDVLGLGSQARMNVPGTATFNWRWRFTPELLTPEVRGRLKKLTSLYDR